MVLEMEQTTGKNPMGIGSICACHIASCILWYALILTILLVVGLDMTDFLKIDVRLSEKKWDKSCPNLDKKFSHQYSHQHFNAK